MAVRERAMDGSGMPDGGYAGMDSQTLLSAEQCASYRDFGFLSVAKITTQTEVKSLLPLFENLFAQRAGRDEGNHYDLVSHDLDDSVPKLPSIINPVNYAPALRNLTYRRNAHAIAKQLLGPHVPPAFEQVILKPAHEGAATPWHQDEAYRVDPNFAYRQISFWLPLADATLANGCMQYIPGSNLGPVLPHHSFQDDTRIHAIECIGKFAADTAFPCRLRAGDVVMHDGRTLHYSNPNTTAEPRYAYIVAFEVPPRRLRQEREFHWNREKQTRNRIRRSQWRKRGGFVVEALRRYRHGMLSSPARVSFELRRAFDALLRLLRLKH